MADFSAVCIPYLVPGIHQPPPQLSANLMWMSTWQRSPLAGYTSSNILASRLAKEYRTRYGRICMMLECLWNVESLLVHNCVQQEIIRYAQAQTQVRVGGIFACHGVEHSTACRGKRMTLLCVAVLHYYYYYYSVSVHSTVLPISNPQP